MFRFLAERIVRFRLVILALTAAVVVASAFLAPKLEFNFTPQQLFQGKRTDHVYREVFAQRFGREDNVVGVLVEGPDVLTPEVLGVLRDLTLTLRRMERVERAESVATVGLARPGDGPGELSMEPILDLDAPTPQTSGKAPKTVRGPAVTPEEAKALGALAMQEPLIRGRMVAADGKSAMIVVWLGRDIQEVRLLKPLVDEVHQTLRAFPLPEGYAYRVSGIPSLRVDIVESLRTEQMTFVPLTGLIFLITLYFLFRRPSGILLPLVCVAIALGATVAVMVLTNSPINIINNVLPTLIVVIGIADSIHMLARQAEEVHAGHSHLEATRRTIATTGAACLLTSATTAVGFLSLLTAETRILQNFAWQAAVGVMLAYLVTLVFLPAALSYLRPVKLTALADSHPAPNTLSAFDRVLEAVGRRVVARPWTVLTVGMLVTAAFGALGSRIVIDTTLLEVFHERHPTFVSTRHIEKSLGGILPIEISLEAEQADHFKDPDAYRRLRELQTFAASLDSVLSTESLADYHQAARAALLADSQERMVMPTSREQIEQLHLLIAPGPDERTGVNSFVTPDFRHARLLVRVADAGARRQLAIGLELEQKLQELFPEGSGVKHHVTGDAFVASAALDSFIRDLLGSLLWAGVIIFVMMLLTFRSLRMALVSILPNAAPLIITLGCMSMMGITLNTTTVIIFAISLGIAVDDSIHFIARFDEEMKRNGKDTAEALIASFTGSGRAIVMTTVMLLVGMGILMLSDFTPTRQFGMLTGITVISALLADLFLLPALLRLAFGAKPRIAPETAQG